MSSLRLLRSRISKQLGKIRLLAVCLAAILVGLPNTACAVVQFQKVFVSEYLDEHPDEEYAKFAKRKARCHICHQGKGNKHNNVYGAHLAKLLDHKKDKKDVEKITAALQKVATLPFDSKSKQGETFKARILASKLPGGELADLKKQPADAHIVLFDGESMQGWTGSTESYEVRDGILASLPGKSGNLYTEAEYSDFILQFEFRLTPGANNGIGIRAPLTGDAAFDGIELQVLDNTAQEYAELKPYQYHGSAYGIAAAQRGHLKPVGEWNEQTVRCVGRKIVVVLNDNTILDADLDEAAPANKTIDGRDHPGLTRTAGHIGLLGHGRVVEFRNLKVQEVSSK
ncbi:MAG: 3-keto-disaccharide hydrolase [Bythopirellula sp.]